MSKRSQSPRWHLQTTRFVWQKVPNLKTFSSHLYMFWFSPLIVNKLVAITQSDNNLDFNLSLCWKRWRSSLSYMMTKGHVTFPDNIQLDVRWMYVMLLCFPPHYGLSAASISLGLTFFRACDHHHMSIPTAPNTTTHNTYGRLRTWTHMYSKYALSLHNKPQRRGAEQR